MRFPTVQSVALIAAILATEGVVTATNCVRGRYYCGATLNDLGNCTLPDHSIGFSLMIIL
jgi:hypothetical protein